MTCVTQSTSYERDNHDWACSECAKLTSPEASTKCFECLTTSTIDPCACVDGVKRGWLLYGQQEDVCLDKGALTTALAGPKPTIAGGYESPVVSSDACAKLADAHGATVFGFADTECFWVQSNLPFLIDQEIPTSGDCVDVYVIGDACPAGGVLPYIVESTRMFSSNAITFSLEAVDCGATLTSVTTHGADCSGAYDVWVSNGEWIARLDTPTLCDSTWTKVAVDIIANRAGDYDTINGLSIPMLADVRTGISVVCRSGVIDYYRDDSISPFDKVLLDVNGATVKFFRYGWAGPASSPSSGYNFPRTLVGGFTIENA
ncbi:hypothetical protein FOA52_012355 [Chlamydomonas sp. UWO 241]|nr:hypothetical protein FOA52_012355 [Chlamydomonas sp. UWO 241]